MTDSSLYLSLHFVCWITIASLLYDMQYSWPLGTSYLGTLWATMAELNRAFNGILQMADVLIFFSKTTITWLNYHIITSNGRSFWPKRFIELFCRYQFPLYYFKRVRHFKESNNHCNCPRCFLHSLCVYLNGTCCLFLFNHYHCCHSFTTLQWKPSIEVLPLRWCVVAFIILRVYLLDHLHFQARHWPTSRKRTLLPSCQLNIIWICTCIRNPREW